jgi:hypothetical protein
VKLDEDNGAKFTHIALVSIPRLTPSSWQSGGYSNEENWLSRINLDVSRVYKRSIIPHSWILYQAGLTSPV